MHALVLFRLSVVVCCIGLVSCGETLYPDELIAPTCDLNVASCAVKTATGQHIKLSIYPKPIPLLKPLQLEARLTDFTASPERIQVVVEGINMYMGYQRTWLNPTLQQGENTSIFQGTLQIPTCEERSMRWKVTLLFPPASTIPSAVFFMNTLSAR